MAKWGNCDFKQLEKLTMQLEEMSKFDVENFCKDVARELAARLLRKVIKRTPVGKGTFETVDGKKVTITNGGTLRRGWTANTQSEAEGGKVADAKTYANSLKIAKMGDTFVIIVKNPVDYSSYVEFGHRQEPGRYVKAIGKKLKKAWVAGTFMLTISEKELEAQLPKIIERKLSKFMEECFNNVSK